MPPRVVATQQAAALIRRLRNSHGALVFHQSGGCCEGSAPMCFRARDFIIGPRDVYLGSIEGCPFYIGPADFDHWAWFQLTIGATRGGGDSFSIEAADGERFATRSHMFTDEEAALVAAAGPPPRGPGASANIVAIRQP